MKRSETISKLAEAVSKFQGQIQNAKKEASNPFFKSFYTDLAGAWDAIRKPLSENGLAIIQDAHVEGCYVYVTSLMAHSSGEWIESEIAFEPKVGVKDDQGNKTMVSDLSPQSVGSCFSYGRRYLLMAQTGLAGEDDDAEGATNHKPNAPKVEAAKPVAKEEKKSPDGFVDDIPTTGKPPESYFGAIIKHINGSQLPQNKKLEIMVEARNVKEDENKLKEIYERITKNGS